jgi:dihydroxyacetone kinase
MKKLINRPEMVVEEMIDGLVAALPGLARLPGHTVIVRADAAAARDRQVAVISGGGSGHEPAHAGYVGRGMLSAAVAGQVFTSPSPDSVLAAIRAVTGQPGALLIVKNYTGDRLNFGLAAEMARAEGFSVEMVIVADDVALTSSDDNAGRRGLAGTVLIHKIAGAAANSGAALSEVAAEARAAARSVGTMGVALSPCTVPAAGKPGFALGETEIELGLGIHGEPGVRRGPLEPADVLVDQMMGTVIADGLLARNDRVVLLINNLGATPVMELAIVARHALATLESRGLITERVYFGTFLSALEMAGVSLSLLRVDDHRLARLDAPTAAPAWPGQVAMRRGPRVAVAARDVPTTEVARPTPPQTAQGRQLRKVLSAACEALIAAAPRLTELDQIVGDGDLGISLARGAAAVIDSLDAYPVDNIAAALRDLGLTLQRTLGGTSGALYAVFFLRGAQRLRAQSSTDVHVWAEAFRAGTEGIAELGGAQAGDRTMLDALQPASEAFLAAIEAKTPLPAALQTALTAAEKGARATANLTPRRGRSSYLGQRVLGHADPGAVAVAVWFKAVVGTLLSQTA